MMGFLALHTSVVIPALIALLGAIALAVDVTFIRPRRRAREVEAARAFRKAADISDDRILVIDPWLRIPGVFVAREPGK